MDRCRKTLGAASEAPSGKLYVYSNSVRLSVCSSIRHVPAHAEAREAGGSRGTCPQI